MRTSFSVCFLKTDSTTTNLRMFRACSEEKNSHAPSSASQAPLPARATAAPSAGAAAQPNAQAAKRERIDQPIGARVRGTEIGGSSGVGWGGMGVVSFVTSL